MSKLYYVVYGLNKVGSNEGDIENAIIKTDSELHTHFKALNKWDTRYEYSVISYIEVTKAVADAWCKEFDRAILDYVLPQHICNKCGAEVKNLGTMFRRDIYCSIDCVREHVMNTGICMDIINNTIKAECECVNI